MVSSIRQGEILQIARIEGRVSVENLAQKFEVTLQTIRRDLAELAHAGALDRVHGGAVFRNGIGGLPYERRRRANAEAKAAIARACVADISDGCAISLNLGTTTEAVARALLHHAKITVFTNSINIASILMANPGCEVVLAGGAVRRFDGGMLGEVTTHFFGRIEVDLAVIGCAAIDGKGDIRYDDPAEVQVLRPVLARARRTFLVADHSKLARQAPERLASLAEVAAFYTDRALPEALARKCAAWGTELRLP